MEHEQALPIGFKLIGGLHNYTIEQVLGQGGFGITYKVKTRIMAGNIKAATYFAVKEFFPSTCWRASGSTQMLYPPTIGDDIKASLADFIYEGKRLQNICKINPNIVQVNEVFEANGTAYYVMEYLDGGDLRKRIKENNGNGLSVQQMLNIMTPIGNAVQCLHNNNMLHLDIKPDNIVMRRDDEGGPDVPALIDFGLAVHFDKNGTPTSKTPSLGISPGYSPVEQYKQLRRFDPRLDVYAFSATCLYLLTGKDPMEALDLPSNFVRSVMPPTVSPQVTQAIERGMSKESASRTGSINNLLVELQMAASGTGGTPAVNPHKAISPLYRDPHNEPENETPRKNKKPLFITLICLGALALIGLGIWGASSLLDKGKPKKDRSHSSDDISEISESSTSSKEEEEIDLTSLQQSLSDTIYSDALLSAAKRGDSKAQSILGECYFYGYGINADIEKAKRWYYKAAEQDNFGFLENPTNEQIDDWKIKYETYCKNNINVGNLQVPDDMKTNEPCLVYLVLNSKSFKTDKERQEWFDLYSLMNQEQVYRLYNILIREKFTLTEIDKKYEKEELRRARPIQQ